MPEPAPRSSPACRSAKRTGPISGPAFRSIRWRPRRSASSRGSRRWKSAAKRAAWRAIAIAAIAAPTRTASPGAPRARRWPRRSIPRLVFERLFSNGRPGETAAAREKREKYSKSVLDFVHRRRQAPAQAARPVATSGSWTSICRAVRELEQRHRAGRRWPQGEATTSSSCPTACPSDYAEHLRIMGDLMVLAFQTDTTRICTFIFADEGSNRAYAQPRRHRRPPRAVAPRPQQGEAREAPQDQPLPREQFAYVLESCGQ